MAELAEKIVQLELYCYALSQLKEQIAALDREAVQRKGASHGSAF